LKECMEGSFMSPAQTGRVEDMTRAIVQAE